MHIGAWALAKRGSADYYKLVALLVLPSLLGLLLVLNAVYRGALELTVLRELDALQQVVAALPPTADRLGAPLVGLSRVAAASEVYCFTASAACALDAAHLGREALAASRVRARGGHLQVGAAHYLWVSLPNSTHEEAIVIQPRLHDPHADIGAVYRQRALIPAAFYLWLMAWVAFTLIHMVQRIKQQQDQMHYMALHDALSGLPNRTQLAESLKAMLATHQAQEGSFAIVMLDLDRFKTINDTLGHQVGDALICAVAQRLRQTLREGDVAARVGGDEFVLLLAHVDYKTCLPLCQRVAQALNAPFQLAGRAVHIGASLGVAIFPGHGKECEALMRYADLAMYAIKMRGGGIQLYSEEIDCIKTSALQKGVTLETLSPT